MGVTEEAVARNQSFRDPAGRLIRSGTRILRQVSAAGKEHLDVLLDAQARGRLQAVIGSRVLREAPEISFPSDEACTWVEHDRIPFPSYPYEWPAEMLYAAGELTLQVAEEALAEGMGLKDATPYNVLFRGPEPVFVDVLSLEKRDPADPVWLAQGQFDRTFLYPLLAHKHFGIPMAQLLGSRRDGLQTSDIYGYLSFWQRLHPDFIGTVTLPQWLDGRNGSQDSALYRPKRLNNREQAEFIVRRTVGRCHKRLLRASPLARRSSWTGYMETHSYAAGQFESKQRFVGEAMAQCRPSRVLDVGCNTGHFSEMAARSGAQVVAIDSDPAVVGATWRRARSERLNILPLVVDLAWPAPARGWRNRECPSFLDRATGHFDMVVMLAVLHHLLVTERIPLEEIVETAASLTRRWLLIEFVGREDGMFQRLTRGRDHLFQDFTEERFEAVCRRHFTEAKRCDIPQSRRSLYLLGKVSA